MLLASRLFVSLGVANALANGDDVALDLLSN